MSEQPAFDQLARALWGASELGITVHHSDAELCYFRELAQSLVSLDRDKAAGKPHVSHMRLRTLQAHSDSKKKVPISSGFNIPQMPAAFWKDSISSNMNHIFKKLTMDTDSIDEDAIDEDAFDFEDFVHLDAFHPRSTSPQPVLVREFMSAMPDTRLKTIGPSVIKILASVAFSGVLTFISSKCYEICFSTEVQY